MKPKRKTIKETRDAVARLVTMTKQPDISEHQFDLLNGVVVGLLWSLSDENGGPLGELLRRGYVMTGEVN